jgi:hypothetical protein
MFEFVQPWLWAESESLLGLDAGKDAGKDAARIVQRFQAGRRPAKRETSGRRIFCD